MAYLFRGVDAGWYAVRTLRYLSSSGATFPGCACLGFLPTLKDWVFFWRITSKIKALHPYNQNVDTVFGLFHDPDFMKDKYAGVGARNVEILECAGSEGHYRIKTRREVPADVPALLKKFLNPWNTLVQSEQWEGKAGGPYHCKVNVEISGVPVSIETEMELRTQGDGCVNDVRLEVKCGIPLVGGKLANFVGGDAEKAVQAEYEFIRNHLAKA